MAGSIAKQTDAILDLWYNFVGSHPYLIQYSGKPKQPDSAYLGAVRQRFKQWILDTESDQAWLDYQHEIGLRHHLTKKNQTDQVQSVPMMPLRYLIAFIYPITATIKDFLANQGHDIEAVEKMHQAWFKSIVLQVTLWSYPIPRGNFSLVEERNVAQIVSIQVGLPKLLGVEGAANPMDCPWTTGFQRICHRSSLVGTK